MYLSSRGRECKGYSKSRVTVAFSTYTAETLFQHSSLCFGEYQSRKMGNRSHRRNFQPITGGIARVAWLFPSSIKYMRQFFEVWREKFQVDSNFAMKGSQLLADESLEADGDQSIRQSAIGGLTAADMNAFWGIGFTHHIQIFSSCRTQEERWYYIRRCAADFWTVEVLKSHLRADDFHHTGALSNNFIQTIPDVKRATKAVRAFKDEYLLDFINVEDAEEEADVDERVLEHALVSEIRKFIQTLGSDFCFISNQHRLIVGEEESFVDLLVYHRALRSLVAIE